MTDFYRDINQTTFATQPYVTNVDAIVQSVRNLVSTRRGERPFRPTYGIDIVDYLFELMDDSASLQLLNDIFEAVQFFEPRVEVNRAESSVTADPDNNSFDVSIVFTIIGLEENGDFTVTETIRQ